MAIAAVAAGAMRIGSMFARGAGKGGGMLRKAILKRTKVRRENIARNKQLNKKLMEKQRRREKASLLKAFKTRGKSGISGVEVPGKSFLDRVLEFFGVLLIGWLVDKLPQIIAWVEDLIKRIKLLVDSLKRFIENLGKWFQSLGKVALANVKSWLRFDFSGKSNEINSAMKDFENAIMGIESAFDDAKSAVGGDITTVEEKDLGPVGPAVTGSKEEKWKEFYKMAEESGAKYPELVAAQFALESNWGTATGGTHNYFGMKATGSESGSTAGTTEYYGGVKTGTSAKFMNFNSPRSAVDTLVKRWYKDYKGYRGVNNATSAYSAADQLRQQGYATDPSYAAKLKRMMKQNASITATMKSGAGDGRQARGASQTPAYQRAVNVGRALEGQGYRAWQHPDFNVHSGYTGSGRERVMRRSYNSYHNYGEALDYPLSHNSEAQLDKLASYFRQNKAALGVAEVIWRSAGHYDHLHVSFKGGGSVDRMPIAGNVDMGAGVGQPQNTVIIIEEEAPPATGGGGKGGSPPIIMGASLNSIIKKHLLTSLAYN